MCIAGVEVLGEDPRIPERGLVSMSGVAWDEAVRRSTVIGALVDSGEVPGWAADAAGKELGLSRRRVYQLVRRHRDGAGLVTEMAPGRSDGGKGGGRLPEAVEAVIREVVRVSYLDRQRCRLLRCTGRSRGRAGHRVCPCRHMSRWVAG